jgi:hypothetical protein
LKHAADVAGLAIDSHVGSVEGERRREVIEIGIELRRRAQGEPQQQSK